MKNVVNLKKIFLQIRNLRFVKQGTIQI